jgi:hypothetical protein
MLTDERLKLMTAQERYIYYLGYMDGLERGGEMLHEILNKDKKENKYLEKSA